MSSPSVSRRSSSTSTLTSMSRSPPPPHTTPRGTSGTCASTKMRNWRRCPNGGTVPGAYPHAATASVGDASRTRLLATPRRRASFLGSTRASPLVTTTTNSPSHANTSDLTTHATSIPSATAEEATSGVSFPGHRTSVTVEPRDAIHRSRSADVMTRDASWSSATAGGEEEEADGRAAAVAVGAFLAPAPVGPRCHASGGTRCPRILEASRA
mmetsp:Transcript_1940/g.4446  ORF Transcript_1940/g.4446 Transcript_1940/m.4446 type:complete len:212 (-) Transcript_1940:107-742(-)